MQAKGPIRHILWCVPALVVATFLIWGATYAGLLGIYKVVINKPAMENYQTHTAVLKVVSGPNPHERMVIAKGIMALDAASKPPTPLDKFEAKIIREVAKDGRMPVMPTVPKVRHASPTKIAVITYVVWQVVAPVIIRRRRWWIFDEISEGSFPTRIFKWLVLLPILPLFFLGRRLGLVSSYEDEAEEQDGAEAYESPTTEEAEGDKTKSPPETGQSTNS